MLADVFHFWPCLQLPAKAPRLRACLPQVSQRESLVTTHGRGFTQSAYLDRTAWTNPLGRTGPQGLIQSREQVCLPVVRPDTGTPRALCEEVVLDTERRPQLVVVEQGEERIVGSDLRSVRAQGRLFAVDIGRRVDLGRDFLVRHRERNVVRRRGAFEHLFALRAGV